jgi:diguanylate cyclase (GGDEF)-like protein
MNSNANEPPEKTPRDATLLGRVLAQNEQVQDKVEQAGSDLSSVNAALKGDAIEGVPLAKVEQALNQSEAIEVKVQEAAAELVTVNDALAAELDERHRLEIELSDSNAALFKSRTDERASRAIALRDAVTGLPNLTLFNDRLSAALAQSERHHWRLAVLFVDLDGFKGVNDTHGHDVGDSLLTLVGQRLQSGVRAGDTVSRRSGDEFLLLMSEAKNEATAAIFAEKIAQSIGRPYEIDGVTLEVKASIGIALYPEDGQSAPDLLKHADAAMYLAKQQKTGPALYSSRPLS